MVTPISNGFMRSFLGCATAALGYPIEGRLSAQKRTLKNAFAISGMYVRSRHTYPPVECADTPVNKGIQI